MANEISSKTKEENEEVDGANEKFKRHETPNWVYGALVAIVATTYFTMPVPLQPQHGETPSIQHVFYYGWLTAVSTGLGAIPLAFTRNLASFWVGISNGEKKEIPFCL
jgi:hypothetical protein